MNVLDLFSGIGGFSLGLERAGMKTVAFCEIEPYCRAVLKKHWPDVPIYDDVRTLTSERLRADGITDIDVICGGFPCQDISAAGKQAGIDGGRSGLWGELARIIGDVRPRYAIVENVSALLSGDSGRWFGRVLGDLAAIGYDAEWHCIPASAVGAPHRRDRVWIISYASSAGRRKELRGAHGHESQDAGRDKENLHVISGNGTERNVADTACELPRGRRSIAEQIRIAEFTNQDWWDVEPDVGRSVDGFPGWLDRFIGWGLTYEQSRRSIEILRSLWSPDVSTALWRSIGGLDRFSQAQILYAFVREYEKDTHEARLLLASAEAFEKFVRGVWGAATPSSASHRSKEDKQHAREHPDIVQVVSQLFTCDSEASWRSSSWEDGIARVADGVPNLAHRLRGLGNAVVPQIPEIIGRAIMETA